MIHIGRLGTHYSTTDFSDFPKIDGTTPDTQASHSPPDTEFKYIGVKSPKCHQERSHHDHSQSHDHDHSPPDTKFKYIGVKSPKLYQDKPQWIDKKQNEKGEWQKTRRKARGWKSIAGSHSEAKKQQELRLINLELAGEETYTQEMTIALKIEVSQEQAQKLYQTFYKVLNKHKAVFCWDLHINRDNHLDWHLTFRSHHDFGLIKQQIRQAITKKHKLTGRHFEVEKQSEPDTGWLDYCLRVKKEGWINGHKVNDYYASKRVLFTKDCKLRRHGHTKTFYVRPLKEIEALRKQRIQAQQQEANNKYLDNHPSLKPAIEKLANFAYQWQAGDWRLTDTQKQAINKDSIRHRILQHIRRERITDPEQLERGF